MTGEIDRPRFTELEVDWAIEQLAGAGLIKLEGSENVDLSDAGLDCCFELERQLGIQNVILLQIFYDRIEKVVKNE